MYIYLWLKITWCRAGQCSVGVRAARLCCGKHPIHVYLGLTRAPYTSTYYIDLYLSLSVCITMAGGRWRYGYLSVGVLAARLS